MAGIEVKTRGALLNGQYRRVIPTVMRRWVQGVMRSMRDYAREIAPVKTGTYRRSLIYRTKQTGMAVEAELYSTDNPAKVSVIEAGYSPTGPRAHWRRRGVYVFRRTLEHHQGLLRSQERVLATDLAQELTK